MTTQPVAGAAINIHQHETVAGTVERFQRLFNTLCAGNVAGLEDVYSNHVRFVDPFGAVEGLDNLRAYFDKVYANVKACRFSFGEVLISDNNACVEWTMHLSHPRLRGGREVTVQGITRLTIAEGRVQFHRDYFDAGEMLYENLPVIGSAIRWVRSYAS